MGAQGTVQGRGRVPCGRCRKSPMSQSNKRRPDNEWPHVELLGRYHGCIFLRCVGRVFLSRRDLSGAEKTGPPADAVVVLIKDSPAGDDPHYSVAGPGWIVPQMCRDGPAAANIKATDMACQGMGAWSTLQAAKEITAVVRHKRSSAGKAAKAWPGRTPQPGESRTFAVLSFEESVEAANHASASLMRTFMYPDRVVVNPHLCQGLGDRSIPSRGCGLGANATAAGLFGQTDRA
jgi:hypothetical protein